MRGSGIVVLGCALLALGCAVPQAFPPAFDPSTDPRPETLDRDLEECVVLAHELTGYRGPAPLSTRTRHRNSWDLKQKQAFDQAYTDCMRERGHEVIPRQGDPGRAGPS